MRWSQGVWSEQRLIQAVNQTDEYFAISYGPSSTAPTHDVREFELYFERLENAGLDKLKRPDLLIYTQDKAKSIQALISDIGGITELPFVPEDDERMQALIRTAIIAVECENSLWKAQQMPAFNKPLTKQKCLGNKLGLPKNAVLPTIIIKEEDKERLLAWQTQWNKSIHIWHAFYDIAYGISLNASQQLIDKGLIEKTTQIYQAPGGSTTQKSIYKIYHHYGYLLATSLSEPNLVADYIVDKNGHILPYVRFEGGDIKIEQKAITILNSEVDKPL